LEPWGWEIKREINTWMGERIGGYLSLASSCSNYRAIFSWQKEHTIFLHFNDIIGRSWYQWLYHCNCSI
jgi:hypothetical protein